MELLKGSTNFIKRVVTNRVSQLSVVFIFVSFVCSSCKPNEMPFLRNIANQWSDEETKRAQREIQNSPTLQQLDTLCRNLPLVQEFSFRDLTLSNRSTFITYHYYSDLSFDKVKEKITTTLTADGWKVVEETSVGSQRATFKNNSNWIRIDYFGKVNTKNDNYLIECGLYN